MKKSLVLIMVNASRCLGSLKIHIRIEQVWSRVNQFGGLILLYCLSYSKVSV